MSRNAERLFYEEQTFRQRRIRVLLAVPPSLLLLLAIWQVVLGHPWGNHPMSNASLIGCTIFLWLVYVRLVRVRLVAELKPSELLVSMRGLWRTRRILLSDIKSLEVVKFDPVRDYGGYGIRITRHGTAYIAGGNDGVRLKLTSGATVVIGSERSKELADAINRLMANRVITYIQACKPAGYAM
jgi:hypothetical protein